ncbi:integrase family protein [Desulfosarcina variabilis str. Montpellier]|uniref:tyrosine-type recombinase/integrase n=1 Tax=Desulfosarcina variabilis TaxID=2300 RepID=UPI003AFA7D21
MIIAKCPQCKSGNSLSKAKCKCGYNLTNGKKNSKVLFLVRETLKIDGKVVWQKKQSAGHFLTTAKEIESQLQEEKERQRKYASSTKRLPMATFMEDTYLPARRAQNYSGVSTEEGRFNNHLLRLFGDVPLIDISKGKVEQYIIDRLKEGANAKTVNRERLLLSQIFQLAETYQLVPESYNPALAARSPEKKSPVEDKQKKARIGMSVPPEKMPELLAQLGETRFLIEFLARSGLRKGLALKMKWSQIRDGYIYFEDWDDKRRKSIPKRKEIDQYLQNLLDRTPRVKVNGEPVDFVFVHTTGKWKGKPFSQSILKGFKGAWKRAGLPNSEKARIHDLRHSFVSNARDMGFKPRDIMEATGHRSVDMINYYDHSDEAAGAVVASAIGKRMFSGPQSTPGVPPSDDTPDQLDRSTPESTPKAITRKGALKLAKNSGS